MGILVRFAYYVSAERTPPGPTIRRYKASSAAVESTDHAPNGDPWRLPGSRSATIVFRARNAFPKTDAPQRSLLGRLQSMIAMLHSPLIFPRDSTHRFPYGLDRFLSRSRLVVCARVARIARRQSPTSMVRQRVEPHQSHAIVRTATQLIEPAPLKARPTHRR